MRQMLKRPVVIVGLSLASGGCGGGTAVSDAQVVTTSLAPTPESRAAMELGTARTLESSRKTKDAVSAYRRIVKEYPDSPQAKIAAERLGALGSK